MVSEHLGMGTNVIFHLLISRGVGIDLYGILNALEQGNEISLVFKKKEIATLFSTFKHLWGECYSANVRPLECFKLFRDLQYRLKQVFYFFFKLPPCSSLQPSILTHLLYLPKGNTAKQRVQLRNLSICLPTYISVCLSLTVWMKLQLLDITFL